MRLFIYLSVAECHTERVTNCHVMVVCLLRFYVLEISQVGYRLVIVDNDGDFIVLPH